MQHRTTIIAIEPNKEPIVRSNFKKLCEDLKLPYHSLKGLKFPIEYKDLIIYKKVLE